MNRYGTYRSPAHLSLQPPHRRGWGSLYAPLSHGRIGEEALRKLLARHPLAQSGATPVYAVDVSVWDRCDAEASPERLLLPSVEALRWAAHRCRLGLPVRRTAGLCARELDRSRGRAARPTRPRRQRGRHPADRGFARSARRRRGRPPVRLRRLLYDPVKVQRALEGSPCQILVRLWAGRRFYGDPSLCDPPEHIGRPRRHGPKMKCSDPLTWPEPSAEHHCQDAAYGSVRVRAWAEMHPKVNNHPRKGTRGPLPIVVGTLILVEVERLPRGERRREPRVLWLWWHGEGEPDLDLLWRSYVRRFDLEHTFRFLKQSMGWTTPRVRHPEQADRWTWLVVVAFAQLRLARACVEDLRLPWERRYDPDRLRPIRVHRTVSTLLAHLGTPAKPPKPCGRWPGRPKGRLSGKAKCYPALKKSV